MCACVCVCVWIDLLICLSMQLMAHLTIDYIVHDHLQTQSAGRYIHIHVYVNTPKHMTPCMCVSVCFCVCVCVGVLTRFSTQTIAHVPTIDNKYNRLQRQSMDTWWRNPLDALSCRSFFAKEPLIIGLFCGKGPLKIRHPMGLRDPVHILHIHVCICIYIHISWVEILYT